jgi:MFS family permease
LLAYVFARFILVMRSIGTYYPTYLNVTFGYSLGQAALISSISTIMLFISAPLAGWISSRTDSRRLIFSLPFLFIGFLLLFLFRVTDWQIIAFVVIRGLVGGVIPTATLTASAEVMRKRELSGTGLVAELDGQNIGQLLGPIVLGQLVYQIGWVYAGYMVEPLCLMGFING